jgi:hypothetical protein
MSKSGPPQSSGQPPALYSGHKPCIENMFLQSIRNRQISRHKKENPNTVQIWTKQKDTGISLLPACQGGGVVPSDDTHVGSLVQLLFEQKVFPHSLQDARCMEVKRGFSEDGKASRDKTTISNPRQRHPQTTSASVSSRPKPNQIA